MEHRCDCGSSHDEAELGLQYNLYQKIDKDNVECLNEYEEGSGVKVFKPWEDRLSHDKVAAGRQTTKMAATVCVGVAAILVVWPRLPPGIVCSHESSHIIYKWRTAKYVESDADEELLFNIPFTGNVKLKGLIVAGNPDASYPSKVKLYKNRPSMTFDDTGIEADQEFELSRDLEGTHEYPIRVVKFSSVHHLTLHFTGNHGAERTRINYIGMKGEWTEGHHHGVTICTYESRPQISDHVADENMITKRVQ